MALGYSKLECLSLESFYHATLTVPYSIGRLLLALLASIRLSRKIFPETNDLAFFLYTLWRRKSGITLMPNALLYMIFTAVIISGNKLESLLLSVTSTLI
jgi:hypothetical protein